MHSSVLVLNGPPNCVIFCFFGSPIVKQMLRTIFVDPWGLVLIGVSGLFLPKRSVELATLVRLQPLAKKSFQNFRIKEKFF